eukprot:2309978-Pleurochrysis_carterae.AAC.1
MGCGRAGTIFFPGCTRTCTLMELACACEASAHVRARRARSRVRAQLRFERRARLDLRHQPLELLARVLRADGRGVVGRVGVRRP